MQHQNLTNTQADPGPGPSTQHNYQQARAMFPQQQQQQQQQPQQQQQQPMYADPQAMLLARQAQAQQFIQAQSPRATATPPGGAVPSPTLSQMQSPLVGGAAGQGQRRRVSESPRMQTMQMHSSPATQGQSLPLNANNGSPAPTPQGFTPDTHRMAMQRAAMLQQAASSIPGGLPFDPRLLPMLHQTSNQPFMQELQKTNPALFNALTHAVALVRGHKVPQATLQAMHALATQGQALAQQQQQQQQQQQHQQQNGQQGQGQQQQQGQGQQAQQGMSPQVQQQQQALLQMQMQLQQRQQQQQGANQSQNQNSPQTQNQQHQSPQQQQQHLQMQMQLQQAQQAQQAAQQQQQQNAQQQNQQTQQQQQLQQMQQQHQMQQQQQQLQQQVQRQAQEAQQRAQAQQKAQAAQQAQIEAQRIVQAQQQAQQAQQLQIQQAQEAQRLAQQQAQQALAAAAAQAQAQAQSAYQQPTPQRAQLQQAPWGSAASPLPGPAPRSLSQSLASSIPPPFSPAGAAVPETKPAVPTPPPFSNAPPVAAWKQALSHNLPITSFTPLSTSQAEELPELSDKEKQQVRHWIDNDLAYAKHAAGYAAKRQARSADWAKTLADGIPWYLTTKAERAAPRRNQGELRVVWPTEKEPRRDARGKPLRTRQRFSKAQLKSMADKPEHIVPVRLEIDHDSIKLRDTLLWNCADTVVEPAMFAQCLCEDFGYPTHIFVPKIVAAIQERVREYQDQLLPIGPHRILGGSSEVKGQGKCDQEETEWWARQSKRRRLNPTVDDSDRPLTIQELAAEPGELDEELRIQIKLDILIGQVNLVDTFEWDLYSEVTPEQFAATYAADLGLAGDFKTAITHDIHEQVQIYIRSLFLVGHPFDGTAILDDDVRMAFLPPVTDVIRKEEQASGPYTPFLSHLSDAEMDKLEKDREKDLKRKRRQTRGRRGIILPDREPVKTNRTLLKTTVGVLDTQPAPREYAPVAQPQPSSSRRAAAIAASAFITNMSKEDDMPIPEPPSPPMSSRSRRAAPVPFAHHALTPMRVDTPDRGYMTPDGFKEEGYGTPQQMIPMEVHKNCLNCGIPDNLSGGMKKGPAGPASLCNQCSRYYARWKRHRKVEPDTGETVDVKVMPSPSMSRASPEPNDDDDDDEDYNQAQNGHPTRPRSAARRKIVQDSPPSSPKSTMSYISEASTVPPPPPPPPKAVPTPERKPVSKPKSQPTPPGWLTSVLEQVRNKYPHDQIETALKAKPAGEAVTDSDWRIKCLDCPGKIYATGPEQTLGNFEVHLKNRAHRTKVAERTGGKAPAPA